MAWSLLWQATPILGKAPYLMLTGLNQHTGNWPGKQYFKPKEPVLSRVKMHPGRFAGTYSLLANSIDEVVARDFLCFAKPDATIVVTDATCLEEFKSSLTSSGNHR